MKKIIATLLLLSTPTALASPPAPVAVPHSHAYVGAKATLMAWQHPMLAVNYGTRPKWPRVAAGYGAPPVSLADIEFVDPDASTLGPTIVAPAGKTLYVRGHDGFGVSFWDDDDGHAYLTLLDGQVTLGAGDGTPGPTLTLDPSGNQAMIALPGVGKDFTFADDTAVSGQPAAFIGPTSDLFLMRAANGQDVEITNDDWTAELFIDDNGSIDVIGGGGNSVELHSTGAVSIRAGSGDAAEFGTSLSTGARTIQGGPITLRTWGVGDDITLYTDDDVIMAGGATLVYGDASATEVDCNGDCNFADQVEAATFESTQATGTAPFTVASTTKVTNLNADQVDGVSISGTPDGTKFLRDDGVWSAVSAGDTGTYTEYQMLVFGNALNNSPANWTTISDFTTAITYSASATNCGTYYWMVPARWGSGNPTIRIPIVAPSGGGSANVVTQVNVYELSAAAADASWLGTAAYDGSNTTTALTCDSNDDFCGNIEVTATGLSIAAGDYFLFEFCRVGGDASDTFTGTIATGPGRLSYTANKGF